MVHLGQEPNSSYHGPDWPDKRIKQAGADPNELSTGSADRAE